MLNEEEEIYFVHTVCYLSESGFPLDRYDLRFLVKSYLDKCGRTVQQFDGNLPGMEWVRSFLKRRMVLSERFASNIKRKLVEVGPDTISEYLNYLKEELEGVDPENV